MRARLALGLVLLAGCPSTSTEDVDGGPPRADAPATPAPDATVAADAPPGTDTLPAPDAEEVLDTGVDTDAGEGLDAIVGADAPPATDSGPLPAFECQTAGYVDALLHGRSPAPITFAPTSVTATVVTPVREVGDYVSRAVSRTTPAGLQWIAVTTLATMFDNLELDHVVHDPSDGATYAAFEAQHGGAALRFYDASGALAAEFTAGGARGRELIGASRQSNFFLARYDAAGALSWVTRFGPDRGGQVAGTISGLAVAGGRVTVNAGVEDSTSVVLGPGEPNELSHTTSGGSAFTAQFVAATGAYAAGSARFTARGENTTLLTHGDGRGDQIVNAAGERVFALTLRVAGGTLRSVRVGVLGAAPVTVSSTVGAMVVAKLGANHEVSQVFTARPVDLRANINATALALAPSGVVVAGGLVGRSFSATPTVFTGATGAPVTHTFDSANGFVAAWNADGSVRYVRRIAGDNNYPANQILIDEARNTFYVVSQGTTASVHDPEGPSPFTPGASGWSVVRYDLTTGRPLWGRTAVADGGIADMYRGSLVGDGFAGQLFLTESELLLGGGQRVMARSANHPLPALARLRFAPDGSLVDCITVVDLLQSASWQ